MDNNMAANPPTLPTQTDASTVQRELEQFLQQNAGNAANMSNVLGQLGQPLAPAQTFLPFQNPSLMPNMMGGMGNYPLQAAMHNVFATPSQSENLAMQGSIMNGGLGLGTAGAGQVLESLRHSETSKSERARAQARAKNRVHAKESRQRKKVWLDDLKGNVSKLTAELEEKNKELEFLQKEFAKYTSKYASLEADMKAVQALFKTCASAEAGQPSGEEASQIPAVSKSDFECLKNHISVARHFLTEILAAPKVDDIVSLCCHGATFHWPAVSKYTNGTIASYLPFLRNLKAAYLPDLAFTQPSVTFSEDHVTVTLMLQGTHTQDNGSSSMTPLKPARRFETTVVYIFSFNSRGKISHLSKIFDVSDMHKQLQWRRKLINEKSEDIFSMDQLECVGAE